MSTSRIDMKNTIITLAGNLDESFSSDILIDYLEKATLHKRAPHVDLRDISRVNSTGIHQLAVAFEKFAGPVDLWAIPTALVTILNYAEILGDNVYIKSFLAPFFSREKELCFHELFIGTDLPLMGSYEKIDLKDLEIKYGSCAFNPEEYFAFLQGYWSRLHESKT